MGNAVITVTGNVVRDLEKTSENAPYKTSVAVDGLVRMEGEKQPKAKFYNISVWGRRADGKGGSPALDMIEYMEAKNMTIKAGSVVTVTGTPTYDIVEKDGVKTTYDGIKVDRIEFVNTGKKENSEKSTPAASENTNTSNGQGTMSLGDEEIELL